MNNFSEKWSVSPCFSEVTLRYRGAVDLANNPCFLSPEDVYGYLKSLWDEDTIEISESFYVLLLNNKKRLLGWSRISLGSKTATIVDVPQVVTLALLGNASSVVIAHNHPSGETRPSCSDIRLTGKISQALELVDLKLDDHLIITRETFYSFAQNGLIHSDKRQP